MTVFFSDNSKLLISFFRYRWNKYCFWNTASQIIQWASVGIWNCTGKCWANVDKEVIKFIGYVIPIRNFISIVFELSGLVDWHLSKLYDRFDDIPRLFHIIFISDKQFLIKLILSHLNQILQSALVSFISIFIKGSFDLCILLIQFVFISDGIFQVLRQPWFSIVVLLFYPSSGKAPVKKGYQVIVKLIESLLGVWGPVNVRPVSLTKRTTKQISI